jgi:hypothetical protein
VPIGGITVTSPTLLCVPRIHHSSEVARNRKIKLWLWYWREKEPQVIWIKSSSVKRLKPKNILCMSDHLLPIVVIILLVSFFPLFPPPLSVSLVFAKCYRGFRRRALRLPESKETTLRFAFLLYFFLFFLFTATIKSYMVIMPSHNLRRLFQFPLVVATVSNLDKHWFKFQPW